MIAWKPHFREGTSNLRMAILKPQIDIIKALEEAFIFEANDDESTVQELIVCSHISRLFYFIGI